MLSAVTTYRCLQGTQICSVLIMSSSRLNLLTCAGASTHLRSIYRMNSGRHGMREPLTPGQLPRTWPACVRKSAGAGFLRQWSEPEVGGSITYLRTDEGWLYLAVVIDLCSRAVIGWSMSPRMTAQLACDALQMALWRRKRPRNVIVHSDRGSQYCSADYQALLKRHNLRGSMSAKGCCYDNACVESFFHSLKVECLHGEHFISREIMRATVFNYNECDYNRWRRHSWCGGLSPEQFENKNLA